MAGPIGPRLGPRRSHAAIGNLVLAGLLALFVLVVGPTIAIIDTLTSTLGAYLSELVRMTPFRDSTWVGDWTIFYWAWWLAWSPFVGLFIARVSKGRTIREFIMGVVLAPTLVGLVWFAIFGGTALNLKIFHDVPLAAALKDNVATTMFVMFNALPASGLLSIVATLLVFIFFVSSGDSATLVLGTMSTGGDPNPPAKVKIIWGVLVAGITAVQAAIIVFALPFSVVLLLMAISLVIAVREDWHAEDARERHLHKALREWVRQQDATAGSDATRAAAQPAAQVPPKTPM